IPLLFPSLARRCAAWAVVAAGSAALAGCGALPEAMPGLDRSASSFTPNDFSRVSMYTRHVQASQQRTCEAARRALLSQGYLVHTATHELVAGRKFYQPTADIHYTVEMRVVCAAEGSHDDRTSAFASA